MDGCGGHDVARACANVASRVPRLLFSTRPGASNKSFFVAVLCNCRTRGRPRGSSYSWPNSCRLDIGAGEVLTLEKQRFAGRLGQRVREAVT